MNNSSVDFSTAPYGVFVLRAALGVMWISHALMKYIVFTVAGFGGFLAKVGFPSELAGPVILVELVGGILILSGVYARHVALLLIPVMARLRACILPMAGCFPMLAAAGNIRRS
jgi:putative oxidoreductase